MEELKIQELQKLMTKFILTYVAFDGATPPRAAMSSIDLQDFLDNNWDKWATPKLISAPGMVNKSAVVFPRENQRKICSDASSLSKYFNRLSR